MNSKVLLGARLFVGIIFVVFGLNGFLNFIQPPEPSEEAKAFIMAMIGTGYFMPVVKVTEILAGALLLANRFVPLALIALTPVVLHIFLLHLFLDINGLPMGALLSVAMLILGCGYRKSFESIFVAKVDP